MAYDSGGLLKGKISLSICIRKEGMNYEEANRSSGQMNLNVI
jgi:hypothetical protein